MILKQNNFQFPCDAAPSWYEQLVTNEGQHEHPERIMIKTAKQSADLSYAPWLGQLVVDEVQHESFYSFIARHLQANYSFGL